MLHDFVRSRMRTAPSPPLSIVAAAALSNRSRVLFISATLTSVDLVRSSKATIYLRLLDMNTSEAMTVPNTAMLVAIINLTLFVQ